MATTYASVEEIEDRLGRTLSETESAQCTAMLEDAAVIIDAYNSDADSDHKRIVSLRMVIRAIGAGDDAGIPLGATQGSMSALGYSQSWTIGNGTVGELYLGKLEKKLLGLAGNIGSYSPIQELVPTEETT